jgi:uncharacterized protein YndB with AHSA1/START domain/uncharacterized protein YciI
VSVIPPVRREVLVDAGPEAAFEVFTARIGAWWPVAGHSVYGAGTAVSFAGGRLLEQSAAGQEAVWGTVTCWEPPHSLAFTWHPGTTPEQASHVTVTFAAAGDQTLVTLEHSGWESFAEPAAARADYDHGWPQVLAGLREHMSQDGQADPGGTPGSRAPGPSRPDGTAEQGSSTAGVRSGAAPDTAEQDPAGMQDSEATWVALVHRPGPAAPHDGASVFGDPQFSLHVGFLNQMRERGYLVAAGPLPQQPGTGMAILRLPGRDRIADATRMATQEDPSVVGGLFTVTVAPWQVLMEA